MRWKAIGRLMRCYVWRNEWTDRQADVTELINSCDKFVLLEKLTGFQPVKKLPAFHGNRKFITVITSAHHLSITWASSIQSIPPHPTSWRSTLILSYHLRLGLPSGLFPSSFPPPKPCIRLSCHTYTLHVPPICENFVTVLNKQP